MPRFPSRFLASRAIFVAAVTVIALALSAALPHPLAFVPRASAAVSEAVNQGASGKQDPELARQPQPDKAENKSRTKDAEPAVSPEWDPKDPAAVQYADGAWGIAYVDNANPPNLLFRRSLGGADPQYWRDQITVESAAERPVMTRLGNTTALFYGKMVGTVREIFLKTSTDDGATWSAPSQLTSGSPANVFQMQVLNLDGTIHLFWSRSDTSGQLNYITSGNLSGWSAPATVGQPVGPLHDNTLPHFDLVKLASGGWAMTWQNVSLVGNGLPNSANNTGVPVVWVGTAADLSSTTWDNQEVYVTQAFGQSLPKAVAINQDSSGGLSLLYGSRRYPSDEYIYLRTSTDDGATWTPAELFGFEPSRSTGGSGGSYARNPVTVKDNTGTIRVFWDMEAPVYAGSYPAQLFRRDVAPEAGITQISVSKEQMAKCGPCVPSGAFVADPINATTGNFTLPETDFAIPAKGPALSFTRTYNAHRLVDSPLGFGWTHNYNEHLETYSRGEVLVIDGSGRNDLYTPKAGGGWDPPPGRFATLVENPDQSFTLTETDFTAKWS